jgi:hypothetical protein
LLTAARLFCGCDGNSLVFEMLPLLHLKADDNPNREFAADLEPEDQRPHYCRLSRASQRQATTDDTLPD